MVNSDHNDFKYDSFTIVGALSYFDEHLLGIVGEDVLSTNIFVKDGWGDNAIQGAIEKKKLKMVKCILNVKSVKEKLLTDDTELGVALKTLNSNFEELIAKYLVNELEIDRNKIV